MSPRTETGLLGRLRRSRAPQPLVANPPSLAELSDHEELLATELLPPEPPATEALGTREQFLTHAYVVLACAVVEEFIERAFSSYVDRAVGACSAERTPTCFLALSVRFADEYKGKAVPDPADHAKALRSFYLKKVIRNNNGVKKANLLTLAKPLGLHAELEARCDDLFAPANSLGAQRGEVAHLSTVAVELRPDHARSLVRAVLDEMGPLVTLLNFENAGAPPPGAS